MRSLGDNLRLRRVVSAGPENLLGGVVPGKSKKKNFKTGDVVCLRSGGAKLTVHKVTRLGVLARWMDGQKLKEATFHAAELMPSDEAGVKIIINGLNPPASKT